MRYFAGAIVFLSITLSQDSTLTLDKIYKDHIFTTAPRGYYTWYPHSNSYLYTKKDTTNMGTAFYLVDIITEDTTLFMPSDVVSGSEAPGMMMNYRFSPDGKRLTAQTSMRRIWRHSRAGKFIVIDAERKVFVPLADGDELRNVKFSPNSEYIAYVKNDNNLYVWNIEKGKEKKITKDGSETILNGHPGWLYEEEFRLYDGYRWSPDSKYIAFWREDQSMVPVYYMMVETETYPEVEKVYYPVAGGINPIMKIGVASVNWGRIHWMDLGDNQDVYIPAMDWLVNDDTETQEQKLVISYLNRKQNHLELWLTDPKKGSHDVIFTADDTCFLEVDKPNRYLPDGSILLVSSQSGFDHLYRLYPNTKEIVPLTSGNWDVNSVAQTDDSFAYFYGTRDGATNRNLYRVPLGGGEVQRLTQGVGYHSANFTPKGNVYVHRYSAWDRLPRMTLDRSDGTEERLIAETDSSVYNDYPLSTPELIQFPTPDGLRLDAMVVKPVDFNPDQKYPIIVYGYGMPGTKAVQNYWPGMLNQLFATEGFIVLTVDSRHQSGYGKARINLGYGDISKWLLKDHGYALDYLGSLGWADTSRVGIWGWSGGGYLAAIALTKGADYFDVGVGVASVTDWKFYDSAWTERYMDSPFDNVEGYKSSSTITYANQFRGKLLLLHGMDDDNVHVQNLTALTDEFVKLGKDVDMFIYANRNHGLYGRGATYDVFRRLNDYFLDNLK